RRPERPSAFGSRAPPWSLRVGRESRGGREGESKHPPSPSGPAERQLQQKSARSRALRAFVYFLQKRMSVYLPQLPPQVGQAGPDLCRGGDGDFAPKAADPPQKGVADANGGREMEAA